LRACLLTFLGGVLLSVCRFVVHRFCLPRSFLTVSVHHLLRSAVSATIPFLHCHCHSCVHTGCSPAILFTSYRFLENSFATHLNFSSLGHLPAYYHWSHAAFGTDFRLLVLHLHCVSPLVTFSSAVWVSLPICSATAPRAFVCCMRFYRSCCCATASAVTYACSFCRFVLGFVGSGFWVLDFVLYRIRYRFHRVRSLPFRLPHRIPGFCQLYAFLGTSIPHSACCHLPPAQQIWVLPAATFLRLPRTVPHLLPPLRRACTVRSTCSPPAVRFLLPFPTSARCCTVRFTAPPATVHLPAETVLPACRYLPPPAATNTCVWMDSLRFCVRSLRSAVLLLHLPAQRRLDGFCVLDTGHPAFCCLHHATACRSAPACLHAATAGLRGLPACYLPPAVLFFSASRGFLRIVSACCTSCLPAWLRAVLPACHSAAVF